MGDSPKVGSGLFIEYNDFGVVGGLPFAIIGPTGSGANWIWGDIATMGNAANKTISVNIQNLSGDYIEVSTDNTDANGGRILNQLSYSIDIDDTCQDTIYAVAAAGGAANVIIALWALASG